MRLVLHDGVCWEVQDSSQSVSNSGRRHLVVGGFVPDGQDVLLWREEGGGHVSVSCIVSWCSKASWGFGTHLEAYGDDGAADLLSHHELLSQHGQDDVLPEPAGQAFAQADDPLAPAAVGIILTASRRSQRGMDRQVRGGTGGTWTAVESRWWFLTSHMGLIPSLKRWKSLCPLRSPGRTRWL